ncbi:uncharacterized protein LOC122219299 [Panthera leo]|uniref:uncharacterized protein LOC122219299 n=1 Tax=Panthera leo TaxID=9689 RepID=UPI001C69F0E8|nr:uncharacterized protein LOC122219299 [Panthera leo]
MRRQHAPPRRRPVPPASPAADARPARAAAAAAAAASRRPVSPTAGSETKLLWEAGPEVPEGAPEHLSSGSPRSVRSQTDSDRSTFVTTGFRIHQPSGPTFVPVWGRARFCNWRGARRGGVATAAASLGVTASAKQAPCVSVPLGVPFSSSAPLDGTPTPPFSAVGDALGDTELAQPRPRGSQTVKRAPLFPSRTGVSLCPLGPSQTLPPICHPVALRAPMAHLMVAGPAPSAGRICPRSNRHTDGAEG